MNNKTKRKCEYIGGSLCIGVAIILLIISGRVDPYVAKS